MALRIGTTRDNENRLIRALIYGDSGIGKTTSARTLNPAKTLIVGTEQKLLPLADCDFRAATISSWEDLEELYSALRDGASFGGEEIKTVFIDSLTRLGELARRAIIDKYRPELLERKSGGKTTTPEKIYEDQMEMPDWGKYKSMMEKMILEFLSLPMNVIFTALAKPLKGDDLARCIAIDGQLQHNCPAYFDLVLYMRHIVVDGEERRVFQTSKSGDCYAKDASGILQKYEPPDWQHIFRSILIDNKKGA
jgi:hypothetical protein